MIKSSLPKAQLIRYIAKFIGFYKKAIKPSIEILISCQPIFYLENIPPPGSPSGALLRLHPDHRASLNPKLNFRASDSPGSPDVTGGEYKARERIHRGMADPRLLAIPAS